MGTEILIYDDEGTGKDSLFHLKNCLKAFFGSRHKIKSVNATGILNNNWQVNCKMICFGGGYDLGYMRKLGCEGCKIIRQFVMRGGIYIGICAGAYFASSYIEFDKNGPLQVVGERHLKLFNGMAVGPIYPGFEYETHKGCRACGIYDTKQAGEILYVMYEGGCMFNNYSTNNNLSILYKYAINDEAAIIRVKCGNGKALMSGVHFEYDFQNTTFDLSEKVKEELKNSQEKRLELVKSLLKEFDDTNV